MKLNALNLSFSTFARNQTVTGKSRTGGYQWQKRRELLTRQAQRSPLLKRPKTEDQRCELCVEDISVYADEKYMYCKGIVRSHGTRPKSNLVVAVEWLDENQSALNTDWKRIEMHLDGERVPLLPNTVRPFIVKAALDRRVKWVKAYAFSSKHGVG
jgi:hypothetical protein